MTFEQKEHGNKPAGASFGVGYWFKTSAVVAVMAVAGSAAFIAYNNHLLRERDAAKNRIIARMKAGDPATVALRRLTVDGASCETADNKNFKCTFPQP